MNKKPLAMFLRSFTLLSIVIAIDSPSIWAAQPESKGQVVKLFDGKSLGGWIPTRFGGEGEVRVEDGKLMLPFGESLTGVTWNTKAKNGEFKLPKEEYEISLEAMRVDGTDFFCGLTFPVGSAPCSLIIGGWGGGVVGLSSIDGYDASENETTQYIEFEEQRWYRIRLRITKAKIEAWLDGEQIIDVPRENRTFTIRSEVELSKPLGLASWQTTAALRNINLRLLSPLKPASDASTATTEGTHCRPCGCGCRCKRRGILGRRCRCARR